jgi:5-formyltetrahydrofolate cyclo-ligase
MLAAGMTDPRRQKRRLRRQVRQRLAALPAERVDADSRRIARRILDSPAWAAAGVVHSYVDSLPGEIATRRVLRESLAAGKRLLVPCLEQPGGVMHHAWLDDLDDLRPGPWGLWQPGTIRREQDLGLIDVVLVPGLLFDRRGYRLGQGGGYYDRFLGQVDSARTLGLTYDDCRVEEIPTEAHDRPVHRVITPGGDHAADERRAT